MASARRGRPRPTARLVRVSTQAKRSTSSSVGSNDSVGTRAKLTLVCSARRSMRPRTTTIAMAVTATIAAATTALTAVETHERAPPAHRTHSGLSPTPDSSHSGSRDHHTDEHRSDHLPVSVHYQLSSRSHAAHMSDGLGFLHQRGRGGGKASGTPAPVGAEPPAGECPRRRWSTTGGGWGGAGLSARGVLGPGSSGDVMGASSGRTRQALGDLLAVSQLGGLGREVLDGVGARRRSL